MKIPETGANSGAYYGNEENVQWQPNGVIIDTGVGGGSVGSGDAGVAHHGPVYLPREHIHSTGYVMAGTYLESGTPYPPQHDDFEDYMWMENEEEFDKQVMQQLEEEALMEQCIEAMLEDEQREQRTRPVNGHGQPTTSNGSKLSLEETISRSKLNPLAAEFVPTFVRQVVPTDDNEKPTVVSANQEVTKVTEQIEKCSLDKQEVSISDRSEETTETPEVTKSEQQPTKPQDKERISSKDVQKREGKSQGEAKKTVAKTEAKKAKPVAAKSETKVPPKKEVVKDVKAVKSEAGGCERGAGGSPELSASAQSLEECSGPKPINYAAAAKANKPKKATTPPITEKVSAPSVVKQEKVTSATKDRTKTDGKVRKNSAK